MPLAFIFLMPMQSSIKTDFVHCFDWSVEYRMPQTVAHSYELRFLSCILLWCKIAQPNTQAHAFGLLLQCDLNEINHQQANSMHNTHSLAKMDEMPKYKGRILKGMQRKEGCSAPADSMVTAEVPYETIFYSFLAQNINT